MRAISRLPRILFFIEGAVPSESEMNEAKGMPGNVSFRNASLVDPIGDSALEECDGVAGKVPPRYLTAMGEDGAQDVSGIGGLRFVHGGEPGITTSQALNLDSRTTNDATEEERRRAHRGLSPNEYGASSSFDAGANGKAMARPDDSAPEGGSSASGMGTDTVKPNAAGWQTQPAGVPGAAQMGASAYVAKTTGDPALAGGGEEGERGASGGKSAENDKSKNKGAAARNVPSKGEAQV